MAVPFGISAARARPKQQAFITRTDLLGWAFISPWVIGFVVFTLFPFAASLFLSFTDWSVTNQWHWIGLTNYVNMVNGTSPEFPVSLRNTLYYAVVTVPGTLVIALALAMLLNKRTPGIALYRTIFYIPAIASGVGTAYLWSIIFSNEGGLLNSFLGLFHIPGPNWLYSLHWSMPALMIVGLWNVGTTMLIFLAGLQGVPQSLYDAAAVDGANAWRKFWSVTIPMLTPAIFFNLVLGVIGSFQVFTSAFIITNGGPAEATLFYTLYLYNEAFQNYHMGFAAALAWVLFVIILAITIIQLFMARLWVYYEGGGVRGTAGPR
jgi:multiple sugar transport system permease protein